MDPIGPSFRRRRILIVEDGALVADELAHLLERWGYEIAGPAPRLRVAEELVRRESIDGALLDINLNGEEVFPLAQWLHDHDVPFIFLTGYHDAMLPDRFADNPRLNKPCRPHRLEAELVRWIGDPVDRGEGRPG